MDETLSTLHAAKIRSVAVLRTLGPSDWTELGLPVGVRVLLQRAISSDSRRDSPPQRSQKEVPHPSDHRDRRDSPPHRPQNDSSGHRDRRDSLPHRPQNGMLRPSARRERSRSRSPDRSCRSNRSRSPSPFTNRQDLRKLTRDSIRSNLDWCCNKCANWNWARRDACHKCKAPRAAGAPKAGMGHQGCQYCGVMLNHKARLKHEPKCASNPAGDGKKVEAAPIPAPPSRPKVMVPPQVFQRHPQHFLERQAAEARQEVRQEAPDRASPGRLMAVEPPQLLEPDLYHSAERQSARLSVFRDLESQGRAEEAAEAPHQAPQALSHTAQPPRGLNREGLQPRASECCCPRTGIDLCPLHSKTLGVEPSKEPKWWKLGPPRNPHHDPRRFSETQDAHSGATSSSERPEKRANTMVLGRS